MINFIIALPILLILFGTPIILVFGLYMRWYREHQNNKYLQEHAAELQEIEEEYNKIVYKG